MSGVHPNPRIKKYDAPQTAPGGYRRRVLCIPDDLRIVAAVSDVLGYLTLPCVWNESDELSEIEMQAMMTEMWLGYLGMLETMLGAIVPMATDILPTFMVWCEGQTLLRANYPDLYGRMHAAFIIDADSFTVPDMRGKMAFGMDDIAVGDHPMGQTGGAEAVTLTMSEIPSHSHIYEYPSFNLDLETAGAPDVFGLGSPGTNYPTSSEGGGNAHENMPPFMVLRFAMVAKWRDGC